MLVAPTLLAASNAQHTSASFFRPLSRHMHIRMQNNVQAAAPAQLQTVLQLLGLLEEFGHCHNLGLSRRQSVLTRCTGWRSLHPAASKLPPLTDLRSKSSEAPNDTQVTFRSCASQRFSACTSPNPWILRRGAPCSPTAANSCNRDAVCVLFCVGNHDVSAESREVCLLKQRVNSLSVLQNLRQKSKFSTEG